MNRGFAPQQVDDIWIALKEQIKNDLEQKRRDLKEIALMLDQSQIEMNKLTQRNASITTHLQQIHSQFDTLPRADIQMAYDSALDAQQRLFVMRGQVEKLHSDQTHLSEYVDLMEKVYQTLEGGGPSEIGSFGNGGAAHVVEMLIQTQEGERQRLSRQMHDGPAQALSNFILQTEIAMRLFDLDETKARSELENLKLAATNTFQKVRDFIFELRPMMLDDLGLVPTLKRYVDILKDETKTEIRLNITGNERRLEPYQEVMVFRAIQELLYNATRHSQASLAKIQLDMGDAMIKVTVDDNGRGFETEKIAESSGMGLKVIADRVDMMEGNLEIDSVLGRGTRVTFELPSVDRKGSA
jgi:two-component system, NarL family, sensor histidine kinase DegS